MLCKKWGVDVENVWQVFVGAFTFTTNNIIVIKYSANGTFIYQSLLYYNNYLNPIVDYPTGIFHNAYLYLVANPLGSDESLQPYNLTVIKALAIDGSYVSNTTVLTNSNAYNGVPYFLPNYIYNTLYIVVTTGFNYIVFNKKNY